MTYDGTPSLGEVVRDKFTNDLMTVKDVSHGDDGEDTYIRGEFVERNDGRQTRHTQDIEPA